MNDSKIVYFLIYLIPDHPELNRLIHGVWSTFAGAKKAFDYYKKLNSHFDYGIASYSVQEEGEGLE